MKSKNQKGFTLVELMGVILILGIILLIAVPAVTKFLGKSKDQYYETTIDNIESATEELLMDYDGLVPQAKDGGTVYEKSVTEFYLKNLVDLKYIDSVEDPNTHASCDEESYVVVTNNGYDAQYSSDKESLQGANQNLQIDVCLKCGDETINDHNSKCSTVEKHYAFVDDNTEEPLSTVKLNTGNYYPLLKDLINNKALSSVAYYSTNTEYATADVSITGVSSDITIKNNPGKVLVYAKFKTKEGTSSTYSNYIIPVMLDITSESILPERIEASPSSVTVYSSASNSSVSAQFFPFNASKSISCSIINKNEKGEVYTPTNRTYSGSVSINTSYTSNSMIRGCKLKSFKFTNYSTATKDTTDTYIRMQSSSADAYVDVPIYNYYG